MNKEELVFTVPGNISENLPQKDIADPKITESTLKKNEKHFRDLIYSTGGFVWEMEENGVITYMDEKLENIMGYHPYEIIGKSYRYLISSGSEESRNNFTSLFTKKEPILGFELNISLKTKQYIWILINAVPFYDEENKFKGYRGVAKDITDSKTEHEKLVWNANILKLLSDSSQLGLYFVDDRNDKILFSNKRFYELWSIEDLEKQVERGLINHERIMSVISTKVKDSNQFRRSINISEESISKLKFENEYILLNKRIIYSYSSKIDNDEGIHIGRLYIFRDISGQRIYALTKSNEKETSNLIEQAPDSIIITDSEANILSVNSVTSKLFGYSEAELLKMKASDIMEPASLFMTPLKIKELDTGKTLLVERVFLNSRGDKINAEVRVKKIPGDKIFAIIRNLSERNKTIKEQGIALKSELLKKLYIKLKSFKHGEDSSMTLNRISLLTRNIEDIWSSPDLSSDITETRINRKLGNLSRAKSLADEYIILSYPQLKQIVSLIEIIEVESPDFKILGLSKTNAGDLKRASEFLKHCFDKFLESTLVKVEVPEAYRNGKEIIENVKIIKKSLDRISRLFENYFLSDFRQEIYIVVNKYRRLHLDIAISFSDFSNVTRAIVNNDELKEILVILFSNSIDALSLSEKTNKIVNINVRDTETRIVIEFENNGVDFDESIRAMLFSEKATTKGENRGFGLYYAKNCLQKYGGNIYLDESCKDITKFVIELTSV